jgi:hypothetical protein
MGNSCNNKGLLVMRFSICNEIFTVCVHVCASMYRREGVSERRIFIDYLQGNRERT